jgi:hypothetical protein
MALKGQLDQHDRCDKKQTAPYIKDSERLQQQRAHNDERQEQALPEGGREMRIDNFFPTTQNAYDKPNQRKNAGYQKVQADQQECQPDPPGRKRIEQENHNAESSC